ncbi:MAG: NAD(P)/FAD-dependent oxidoreductase [Chloroflexi bacterium]|nr:NAD(P)/FAD-dependent oxidoreductase [Chloroflexota bacterium]
MNGVEFAQMYSRFGTKVTIICRSARIMAKEEPELSKLLGDLLVKEGIDCHLSTEVVRAGKENGKRFVIAENDQGEQRFEAEVLLLAAGRIARLDGLGLDQTDVAMRGPFIKVDKHLKTTAPNIWSLGDANGQYMFTHRARYDGPISALNAVNDANKAVDYRVVPRAVFTEPALASVGMNEETAKKTGRNIKTGKAYFKHSGRANAMGQPEGLAKIVVDAETKEILGAQVLGVHADILIHEVVVAMYENGTLDRLTKSIHIHPTLSEVVYEAARAAR